LTGSSDVGESADGSSDASTVAEPGDPGPEPPIPADVIVVAAGHSTRMAGQDKLLAQIGGRPLLAWTLEALDRVPGVERIVVVTAPERVAEFEAASWLPPVVRGVVAGGTRRQDSVAAGFAALGALDPASGAGSSADDRVLLVHDGARPAPSLALIDAVIRTTARHGAAIPVVPVAETVKRVVGELVVATVERSELATAQTPQGVRHGLLREAYERFPPDGPETWTDEAALLEACRIAVHVVPGDPSNLKVTLPADLRRAEAQLTGASGGPTGIGHDQHPFGPGEPLALGGIVIAGAPRLHGHSDGDVALHAVCDALLGASGLGDLGRLFPAGPSTPAGIASAELVAGVRRRLTEAGWAIAGIDLTIVAARPRLAGHLEAMRAAIAELLGVDPSAVNVKASTGNLAGDEGAGRSISAVAIASLEAAR
jgi:2-C-methyl-D-erythritol 4-phosphate cytidylyltransferase / 2-C-methyl-D-erythritol 2,4-cyclodiphosphate synthase